MCMPRLSLYKPEKGKDFKFIDNRIYEMFTMGGTDVFVHKYLGPKNPDEADATADQPRYDAVKETNIQDMLQLYFSTFGFTVVYSSSKGNITINSSSQLFRIVSDRELQGWPASTVCKNNLNEHVPFNQYDLQSANSILRNTEIALSFGNTFTSQFIDLLNTHSIFIHSPNIGSFETLGPRGESTIIKKIPVSSSFGYLIIDSVVATHDRLDVSNQMFKTLEFSLKNIHGNVINLHGSSVSFSLIFETYE